MPKMVDVSEMAKSLFGAAIPVKIYIQIRIGVGGNGTYELVSEANRR